MECFNSTIKHEEVSLGDNKNEKNLILDLPTELFLQICSYLSARTVIKHLSLVCKHLNNIIKSDSAWRNRIYNKWPNKYPAVEYLEIDWKRACIEREDQYELWAEFETKMKKHTLNGHYGNVDCLHLMNDGLTCVSGARDHTLAVWDIKTLYNSDINNNNNENNPNNYQKSKYCTKLIKEAHNGWIWSIDSYKTYISSGSWDKTIAIRDLNEDFKICQILQLKSAVLCQSFKENSIIAGGYDKKIYLFDLRSPTSPTKILQFHKGPIVSLQSDNNIVITASEDKKILITDLRMTNNFFKKIEFNETPISTCYKYNHLWVGETVIHLYDGTNNLFEHVESIDLDHKRKIASIQFTLGSLITYSKDRTLKFSEPNLHPNVIKTISFEHEPGALQFMKNTFVIAKQSAVDVYTPNELYYLI